jgi:hypothetical protein
MPVDPFTNIANADVLHFAMIVDKHLQLGTSVDVRAVEERLQVIQGYIFPRKGIFFFIALLYYRL